MSAYLHLYQQQKQLAERANHRQLMCLQGSQTWCFTQTQQILEQQTEDYHWCGQAPPL
ncbi:hypothetical protein [Psychromonas sp. KJ10-2]|uniref:hypothetical protein n=1 Tax=Psychromonas sp. KJ10-2 TaxID=3391822 RepID=UPI0039B6B566